MVDGDGGSSDTGAGSSHRHGGGQMCRAHLKFKSTGATCQSMARLPTWRLSCLTEIVQKLVLTFRVSLSQCHDRWHKYVYQNMFFSYIYSLSQPIDNWIVHIITFSWLDSASIKQGARSVQMISLSIASIPASPRSIISSSCHTLHIHQDLDVT